MLSPLPLLNPHPRAAKAYCQGVDATRDEGQVLVAPKSIPGSIKVFARIHKHGSLSTAIKAAIARLAAAVVQTQTSS